MLPPARTGPSGRVGRRAGGSYFLTAKGAVTMNEIEKLRAALEAQLRVVAEARYLVRAAEVKAREAADTAARLQREYQSKREDLKALADEVTRAMADERSNQHALRYGTAPEQVALGAAWR